MLTIEETKKQIQEYTGCTTVNFLRFQFQELRQVKGNTKEFWRQALYLCRESYLPKKKTIPANTERRMLSKVNFTQRETDTIVYAIYRDTFGSVKVDPDLISQAYIVEDMYYFYYYDELASSIVCHPIYSKDFERFAKDYEQTDR